MNLDEAIQHCEEVAKTNERICATELSVGLPDIYRHKDEAKKCAEEHRQLAEWLKELKAYRNKSEIPTCCGDAISRQAVDDSIYDYSRSCNVDYSQIMEYIEKLPSVTPQQRSGRWRKVSMDKYIQHATYYYECSECGDQHIGQVNYCPNCGAKMEVQE